ncbi:MAG: hypothetical protein ACREN1_02435 [Candidatus Dormibacteria bacterium]
MIRLSVGVEDVRDLLQDLTQALRSTLVSGRELLGSAGPPPAG